MIYLCRIETNKSTNKSDMAKKKYVYDYPEYREIGKNLSAEDIALIATQTGKTREMVWLVLRRGRRRNRQIVELGRRLALVNQKKNEIVNHQ